MSAAASDLIGFDHWYRSSRFEMLDFDVSVHTDDETLAELIDDLYEPLRAAGESEHILMIGRTGASVRPEYFVAINERIVIRTPAPSVAFAHLLFVANQEAIEQTDAMVRMHAAAAVIDGLTVVIPGAMGAGKSTLVAGLAGRGHGYVTDEVVAWKSSGGLIRSYARPISLGQPPESLGPIGWVPSPSVSRYLGTSGVVPARGVGFPTADPPPVGLVVLAQYEPDAATTVTPLSSVEGLVGVAVHTFHLDAPRMLDSLSTALQDVPVYSMVSGDLTEALDAVTELVRHVAELR